MCLFLFFFAGSGWERSVNAVASARVYVFVDFVHHSCHHTQLFFAQTVDRGHYISCALTGIVIILFLLYNKVRLARGAGLSAQASQLLVCLGPFHASTL